MLSPVEEVELRYAAERQQEQLGKELVRLEKRLQAVGMRYLELHAELQRRDVSALPNFVLRHNEFTNAIEQWQAGLQAESRRRAAGLEPREISTALLEDLISAREKFLADFDVGDPFGLNGVIEERRMEAERHEAVLARVLITEIESTDGRRLVLDAVGDVLCGPALEDRHLQSMVLAHKAAIVRELRRRQPVKVC
jgi:hypothetical protein